MNDVVDAGDALIGDIPDPDPGDGKFLASIFAPANLEFFYDGPGLRTNVVFDKHLPNTLGSPSSAFELDAQGIGARGTATDPFPSSTGRWRLYAQGAYEGAPEEDRDPDTEDFAVGVTGRFGGKYSFVFMETIRDYASTNPILGRDEAYTRLLTLAHELLHEFGLVDEKPPVFPPDIMEPLETNTPRILPEHLRLIRRVGQSGSQLTAPSIN